MLQFLHVQQLERFTLTADKLSPADQKRLELEEAALTKAEERRKIRSSKPDAELDDSYAQQQQYVERVIPKEALQEKYRLAREQQSGGSRNKFNVTHTSTYSKSLRDYVKSYQDLETQDVMDRYGSNLPKPDKHFDATEDAISERKRRDARKTAKDIAVMSRMLHAQHQEPEYETIGRNTKEEMEQIKERAKAMQEKMGSKKAQVSHMRGTNSPNGLER